jgi:L-methionine (R)-S-oxide reductase
MAETIIISGTTKQEKYESLIPQIKALVEGEPDLVANTSNIAAALKQAMNFLWVGMYFVRTSRPSPSILNRVREPELVLGPFQGPVACTRIGYGKGVCGTAWQEKQTIIVEDVEKFPGHISCSSESKSEIVIPCFKNGEVFAVLDVDSDKLGNFDATDKQYLEEIVKIIETL